MRRLLLGLALLCGLAAPAAEAAVSINSLGGLNKPGVTTSTLTEIWYSATLGNDVSTGSTSATPIKTITKLGQIFWGFGLSGAAVLYTDAPLSAAEAALFYQFTANDGRSWSLVDGTKPFTPPCWYDARDINGNGDGDAGLIDGNAYSSLTWKNKGSAGSSGDLTIQTGTVTFRKVASSGKLRNASALEFAGASYFKSGAVGGLAGPTTWVVVFNQTNGAATNRIVDGIGGANFTCLETLAGGSPQIVVFNNTQTSPASPLTGTISLNQYHSIVTSMNEGSPAAAQSANFCVDGVAAPGQNTVGSLFAGGVTIGAGNDGSQKFNGQIIAVVLVDGPLGSVDPTAWEQWIRYNFGVLPQ